MKRARGAREMKKRENGIQSIAQAQCLGLGVKFYRARTVGFVYRLVVVGVSRNVMVVFLLVFEDYVAV
jgi:hypothetical protein